LGCVRWKGGVGRITRSVEVSLSCEIAFTVASPALSANKTLH
jgi:hypothetical protein